MKDTDSGTFPDYENFEDWGPPQFVIHLDPETREPRAQLRGARWNGVWNATDVFRVLDLDPKTAVDAYLFRFYAVKQRNPDMTPQQASEYALRRWWYAWHIAKIVQER